MGRARLATGHRGPGDRRCRADLPGRLIPASGPIARRDLIRGWRALGFEGPYTGTGKHPEYTVRGDRLVRLPNAHRGDIGANLLARILAQAGVTRDEWIAA